MLAPSVDCVTLPVFECPAGYTPLDKGILALIEEGKSTFTKAIEISYRSQADSFKNTEYVIDLRNTDLLHQMSVSLTAEYLRYFVA